MDILNGSLFKSTLGVLLLAMLQAPLSPPLTMLRTAKRSCCERTKKMDGLVHFERVLNIVFGGIGGIHFWSASASPGPMDPSWSCGGSCAVHFFCPPPDWKSGSSSGHCRERRSDAFASGRSRECPDGRSRTLARASLQTLARTSVRTFWKASVRMLAGAFARRPCDCSRRRPQHQLLAFVNEIIKKTLVFSC